jgi:NAD(P)-dependent dehydrogenase (short-subunit alcohol dehydrogenase family)
MASPLASHFSCGRRSPDARRADAGKDRNAMELDLAGRIAIVTGASKGIGLAVARGLVANGAHVVAGARKSSAELDELARSGHAQIALVDLAGAAGPAALVAQAGDRIDILINNVGSAPARTGGFLSISDADWLATLEINLMAAVRATRSVLPAMIAAGQGAIVSTSSVNAHLPDPAVMDYSAAKAALASFSKALSKEVGPHGIRVNTVSPGPVATDLWLGQGGVAATVSAATGADPKDVASQAASQMVTGRFTRPEEVADLVVYLASDRAANITGADFAIDGGLIPTL